MAKVHQRAKSVQVYIDLHSRWQTASRHVRAEAYSAENPEAEYQAYLKRLVGAVQLAASVNIGHLLPSQVTSLKRTWFIASMINPGFFGRQATPRNPLARMAGKTLAYPALCREHTLRIAS